MNAPPNSFYARAFAICTIGVLVIVLALIVQPFLSAIAWALLLAFLLQPLQHWLTARLGGRAWLSSTLLTFGTLVIFIAPLVMLGIAFVHQAATLLERLQDNYGGVDVGSVTSLKQIPLLGTVIQWIVDHSPFSAEQVRTWLMTSARALLEQVGHLGTSLFVGAMGTLVAFATMLFLLFFFIRDGAAVHARLRALVPMPEERKEELLTYLANVTRAVVFGTLLTAIMQGTLVGVSFAIVHLPSPVVFSVVAALFALLPFGGTAFVWLPATFVLAAQGRYGAAVFMLLWGALLVGLMDNVVKTMLISGRAEVPTLAAFIGVIGGLAAFGPIGMFIGPVILALALALLRWAEQHLGDKTQ